MNTVGSLLLSTVIVFGQLCADETQERPYTVIIYGTRGSGRATMSVNLRKEFSFPDISLASLLATHVAEETRLGKKARDYVVRGGKLPSDLALEILCERLSQPDCAHGVFLEEFPLTLTESKDLYDKLSSRFFFMVISIDVSDDWLIKRCQHRSVCHTCGRVYDDPFSCPKHKGQCDICSGTLHQRTEDTPEAIMDRLSTYRSLMAPILDFFQQRSVLTRISGDRDYDETYRAIVNTIFQKTGIAPTKQPTLEGECLEPACLSSYSIEMLGEK
jgi:adenylate kinase